MSNNMKILIAYDGSRDADAALLDLQRAGLPRHVTAHVLSVQAEWLPAPASYGGVETGFTKYVQQGEQEALALARQARATVKATFPEWEVHAEAATGSPGRLITQRAQEFNVDLIVVGAQGHSTLGRIFLGSVSQKVLHTAHRSVRIARGRLEEPKTTIRLLVGIDGSPGSAAAIKAIVQRHWPAHCEARIVNGFPILPSLGNEMTAATWAEWIAEEKARIDAVIEKASGSLRGVGLTVSVNKSEEDARQLLLNEAERWGADCIFVGAQGLGAFERLLLGSVSSFVATHAHCSVEIVQESKE